MSPPSPKLELGPEPAPTVPASRSDFKTFDPDAACCVVPVVAAAFGVQTELNLLPTSMGRRISFDEDAVAAEVDSPQTLRTVVVGSCCSGIIQIEPSDGPPDAASDGCCWSDLGVELSQMLGEKLGDCGWDGSRTAVAQGFTAGGGVPVASGDDLAGGLSGGPPQSDLLPQMVAFSCCGCCGWLAVARPLPALESPVKPESMLLALLVLLRLRSSWMNEFIAAMAADVEDVVAATGEDGVSSATAARFRLELGELLLLTELFRGFGDSNGASCYGHCWNSCIGCLV